ncbi:hypothetical protein Gpo141_00009119 [Globisporangium polare]
MASTRNAHARRSGGDDASAAAVPSLVKLCLQTIGKRLKHFFNATQHAALVARLSEQEKQLLLALDLSRLELFEHQKFRRWIAAWRLRVEKKRRDIFKANMNLTHLAETVPIYALRANLGRDPQFQQLKVSLHLEEPPDVELRVPVPSGRRGNRPQWANKKKWIGTGDVQDPASSENNSGNAAVVTEEAAAATAPSEEQLCDAKVLKSDTVAELVRCRSSITNVGCGSIADLLQSPGSRLHRVCLQFCQVTDAGAILLACALRTTAVLRELDLSNTASSPFKGTCMDNEIGSRGAQALALALEVNTSLTFLSLSGNPVQPHGALALSKMLHVNTALKRLELERTIPGDSANALIDAFSQSKSLQVLNLNWCSLKPEIGAKFAMEVAAKNQK